MKTPSIKGLWNRVARKKTGVSQTEPTVTPGVTDIVDEEVSPSLGTLEESLLNEGLPPEQDAAFQGEDPLASVTTEQPHAILLDKSAEDSELAGEVFPIAESDFEEESGASGKPTFKEKMGDFGRRFKEKLAYLRETVVPTTNNGIPIRILMGYLPEVTERDALEYALGIAEKHFEQLGMVNYTAERYGSGFAFEVHEGGNGKAFLPEILDYFEQQGPYSAGESTCVVIKTATRNVEVQRSRDGLAAIILPESSTTPVTDWLVGTPGMTSAVNRRTGFLVAGGIVFATGVIAMLVVALFARLQPYENMPEQKVEFINSNNMPIAQWAKIEAVPANSYIKALRFRNNKWEAPEIATEDVSTSAASANPGATPSAGGPNSVLPPPLPANPVVAPKP